MQARNTIMLRYAFITVLRNTFDLTWPSTGMTTFPVCFDRLVGKGLCTVEEFQAALLAAQNVMTEFRLTEPAADGKPRACHMTSTGDVGTFSSVGHPILQ